jgi:hypothetical protein
MTTVTTVNAPNTQNLMMVSMQTPFQPQRFPGGTDIIHSSQIGRECQWRVAPIALC